MKNLDWFIDKGLLARSGGMRNMAGNYMRKARQNIVTMELLNRARDFRDELELPEDYEPDEWVVIAAYYAMYMASLAVLARFGLKSRNHTATIMALEEIFVRKRLLEKKYVAIIEKTRLRVEEIEKLEDVRKRREIAQYSPTKDTTREMAEKSRKDAHEFADRMEGLFDSIG